MSKEFSQAWLALLSSIGTRNMPWGVTGGNEWASFKQTDENDYNVQIFTHGGFEEYKKQKYAIMDFFAKQDSILVSEHDVKNVAFGYWKELLFLSKQKVEEQKRLESERMAAAISIGSIYAPGGIVNLGTISDSPISIDNTVHQIERMIEEQGGEDKAELLEFLNETKMMVEEYIVASQITPKKGFLARLNTHIVKHGWFYGAILQLLGTAAIQIIG